MKKICVISDTHTKHRSIDLPISDILIHCGDFSNRGEFLEIKDFLDWFTNQPHKYKIFIAGNHELTLDYDSLDRENILHIISNYTDKYENLFYLEHSSIIIEGIKIFGSAFTPEFYGWAFNVKRGKDLEKKWNSIPDDTNILITHGPPYGYLDLVQDIPYNKGRDLHQGCEDLSKKLKDLKQLKASIFGHLHLQGCQTKMVNNTIFVNAAQCDEQYNLRNQPIVIEI